jgi:hypothetical protein
VAVRSKRTNLLPSAWSRAPTISSGVALACVGPLEGGRSGRLLASLAIEVWRRDAPDTFEWHHAPYVCRPLGQADREGGA